MLKNVWVALLSHLNISQPKQIPTPHHTIIWVEVGLGLKEEYSEFQCIISI